MSHEASTPATHRMWRGAYAALLVLLPRTLRERHGREMLDLYDRELSRRAGAGILTAHTAALAGLVDLVGRGLHERVAEERLAVKRGEWIVVKHSASAFAIAFSLLTILMVALSVRTRFEAVSDERAMNIVLYSVPFTAAITIPMAIFMAVLFATLKAPRRIGAARLTPLMSFAVVVAGLSFMLNAEIVPRTNARLQAIQAGTVDAPRSDRSMTLSELRVRSRQLTNARGPLPSNTVRESLANLEVEIHKKGALAAACVLLTLLAFGLARWAPRAGLLLQIMASVAVFGGYYTILTVGETLADRLVISPALGMWSANIMALLLAMVSLWASRNLSAQGQPRST